jgi:hypothetical protein
MVVHMRTARLLAILLPQIRRFRDAAFVPIDAQAHNFDSDSARFPPTPLAVEMRWSP